MKTSKFPFMCYWDEKSEIRNYGLFGPQPPEIKLNSLRTDGTTSNHSGRFCFIWIIFGQL